jgi:hypothetical protein
VAASLLAALAWSRPASRLETVAWMYLAVLPGACCPPFWRTVGIRRRQTIRVAVRTGVLSLVW